MQDEMSENGSSTVVAANRHMDAREIDQFSEGGLSEMASAPFFDHLLTCARCRALVEKADAYVAAMRAAARELRKDSRPPTPRAKPPSVRQHH